MNVPITEDGLEIFVNKRVMQLPRCLIGAGMFGSIHIGQSSHFAYFILTHRSSSPILPPTMRWYTTALAVLVVLSLLPLELRAQAAPPPGQAQKDLILVLLSGEVIQGEVSQLDDRYLVVLPTGRIFVPVSNVEIVCNTLDEAYRYRKSRMGQGQVQDHAELAQWCERHGLDAAAREQLQIAKRLNPNHPIVGLVERRLATALESAEAEVSEDAENSGEPTPQQLADFAAGLPHGTVESFTRVVQPLLLNRCATAGCHTDRSGSEFRLERSRPGTPLSQTSTQRNLLATLKLMDSRAPEQSELLRPTKCPHRLRTEATLSLSRTGQYKFLVAWVNLLAKRLPAQPATAAAPAGTPSELPPTIRSGPPVTPASFESPAETESMADRLMEAVESAPSAPGELAPAAAGDYQAADPFDPELFNKRYGTAAPVEPVATDKASEKIPVPNPFFGG